MTQTFKNTLENIALSLKTKHFQKPNREIPNRNHRIAESQSHASRDSGPLRYIYIYIYIYRTCRLQPLHKQRETLRISHYFTCRATRDGSAHVPRTLRRRLRLKAAALRENRPQGWGDAPIDAYLPSNFGTKAESSEISEISGSSDALDSNPPKLEKLRLGSTGALNIDQNLTKANKIDQKRLESVGVVQHRAEVTIIEQLKSTNSDQHLSESIKFGEIDINSQSQSE